MRILVIGDVVLDRDIEGKVARIAPDAPVPVLDVGGIKERAGGAGLAATGTRSVILFGPTTPARWGPLIDPHLHQVLQGELLRLRVAEVVAAALARL